MMNIQNIQNVFDCVPLYLPHSLYLKPLAKIHISVALPNNKTGKAISNLELMEKLSNTLKPDKFHILKVAKTTVDVIRFEAELEDRSNLRAAISRLDGISVKISGFSDMFRVRASEPKDDFPTRHDWDTFFRDAKNMNEMKAGERPDTIHLTNLPIRWFCPRHMENEDDIKPSESIFKRIFEKFGAVRLVDIPICDPYRHKMNLDINGMKTFSYDNDILFEAYVQFKEYLGFVRTMDEFRGMKLVKKFIDKTQAINIGVHFDTSKHLSDAQIQRRDRVRKRLISKAQAEEEKRERDKKLEEERVEREKIERLRKEEDEKLAILTKQREREAKRREKHLKQIEERGHLELTKKIRTEERRLKIAQRKLESIRILEHLYERIHMKELEKSGERKLTGIDQTRENARKRLVQKYKIATENLVNEQKKKAEEVKINTPILGLLKDNKRGNKKEGYSSDEALRPVSGSMLELNSKYTNNSSGDIPSTSKSGIINPFKTGVMPMPGVPIPPGNSTALGSQPPEMAEWMKSLSMFPYMQHMLPALSAMYRPPVPGHVNMMYRGSYQPRIRGRGRGRGSWRGGGTPYYAHGMNHHANYDNYTDDSESGRGGYYHKSSYSSRSRYRSSPSRSYSRSRSRSRSSSSSRSRTRSRTRSRYRHHSRRSYSKRSESRSRSYSRSKSRSRSKSNKKLVSTLRSRSTTPRHRTKPTGGNSSRRRSRSTSRSSSGHSDSRHSSSRRHRSKNHNNRNHRTRHRSSSQESNKGPSKVVLETEKLVRSAEAIKSTVEKETKIRLLEEKLEIRKSFKRARPSSGYITRQINTLTERNDDMCSQNDDRESDNPKRSSHKSYRNSRSPTSPYERLSEKRNNEATLKAVE